MLNLLSIFFFFPIKLAVFHKTLPVDLVKDTHSEKVLSNKTLALTKRMNMDIWVVGISNQPFRRDSYSEVNFLKNKVVTGKTPSSVISALCTFHSIYFNIGFWQVSFVWKYCTFNLIILN